MIDQIKPLAIELGQTAAQVRAVVAGRHANQHAVHRLLGRPVGQIGRDVFKVVVEGEGIGARDLVLHGMDQAQHELGAVAHRGRDVADDHQPRLLLAPLVAEGERHAPVPQVPADGGLQVQGSGLLPLLSQRNPAPQRRGQAAHLLAQDVHLVLAQAPERRVQQILDILGRRSGLHVVRDALAGKVLQLAGLRLDVGLQHCAQFVEAFLGKADLFQQLGNLRHGPAHAVVLQGGLHAPHHPFVPAHVAGPVQARHGRQLIEVLPRQRFPPQQAAQAVGDVVLQLPQGQRQLLRLLVRQVFQSVVHVGREFGLPVEEDGKQLVEDRQVVGALDQRGTQADAERLPVLDAQSSKGARRIHRFGHAHRHAGGPQRTGELHQSGFHVASAA